LRKTKKKRKKLQPTEKKRKKGLTKEKTPKRLDHLYQRRKPNCGTGKNPKENLFPEKKTPTPQNKRPPNPPKEKTISGTKKGGSRKKKKKKKTTLQKMERPKPATHKRIEKTSRLVQKKKKHTERKGKKNTSEGGTQTRRAPPSRERERGGKKNHVSAERKTGGGKTLTKRDEGTTKRKRARSAIPRTPSINPPGIRETAKKKIISPHQREKGFEISKHKGGKKKNLVETNKGNALTRRPRKHKKGKRDSLVKGKKGEIWPTEKKGKKWKFIGPGRNFNPFLSRASKKETTLPKGEKSRLRENGVNPPSIKQGGGGNPSVKRGEFSHDKKKEKRTREREKADSWPFRARKGKNFSLSRGEKRGN